MKKLLIFITFIFSTLNIVGQSGPALYPGIIELDLSMGNANSKFTIFNQNKSEKLYKISVKEADNQGNISVLADNLKVFPKFVALGPGENQDIRIIAKNFDYTTHNNGEYRASLMIEEIESNIDKKYTSSKQEEDMKAEIKFLINIGMAVYGYVGDLQEEITTDLTVGDNYIRGKLINSGNYSYPIKYQILNNDEIIQENSIAKVIRERDVDINISIPPTGNLLKIIDTKKNKVLYEMNL